LRAFAACRILFDRRCVRSDRRKLAPFLGLLSRGLSIANPLLIIAHGSSAKFLAGSTPALALVIHQRGRPIVSPRRMGLTGLVMSCGDEPFIIHAPTQ
jgi:hypothetical protein